MIRAPRKGFWHDQLRAGIVGAVLLAVLLVGLTALRIPHDIETKALQAVERQGG